MEAFGLLKYWRGSSGGRFSTGGGCADDGDGGATRPTTTTIVTAVTNHAAESDDDDGPFFDLEFAVHDEEEEEAKNEDENESQNDDVGSQDDRCSTDEEQEEEDGEEERESSNSSESDASDPNFTLSPSDNLFFKGKLVPTEPSSLAFNSAEPNSKPQLPGSLLKSATKLRVSMSGFKNSKQNANGKTEQINGSLSSATAIVADNSSTPKQQQKQETVDEKDSKFLTVKLEVEEVPIMSLFTRDNNSSRKSQKQSVEDSEERKFSKDVMQKYLKKVKPLYIRVTKSVQSTPLKSAAEKGQPPPDQTAEVGGQTFVQVKSQKQVKSRSAAAGVVASRRDDSLRQQQDGIQSAILHCKRSFNRPRA